MDDQTNVNAAEQEAMSWRSKVQTGELKLELYMNYNLNI